MNVMLHESIRRLGLSVLIFFLALPLLAQVSSLQVIGVVEQDMIPIENAKVTLSKNGTKVQSIATNRKGEFRFEMDINSEYLIEISKSGLLTKKIAFNTEIPGDVSGKWTMEFAMSLFPGCEGVNTSALDNPVDRVKYSSNEGDFISDASYVRNQRGRMERMMIDIENCQVETYSDAMDKGNRLMKEGKYEEARAEYNKAMEVYPGDRTAQRKLADIYKKIGEEKKTDDAFDQAIAQGDQFYNQQNYEAAKEKYTEALRLKPDTRAQNRVNEINQIVSSQQQAAQASAEKERSYNDLISQANAAQSRNDYEAAKQYYQQAARIKPDASLPKQKVNELTSLIAQQQQTLQKQQAAEKAYTEAMAMGQAAQQAGDYEAAKKHFNRAQMMKPNEALPRQKISEIDRTVASAQLANEQAERAALQQKIDQAIAEGDRLMAQKDYDGAQAAYQNALQLNPNEAYAKQQIRKAQTAKENAMAEQQRNLERAFQNDLQRGDDLVAAGNYTQAMEAYKQALQKKPNDPLANQKLQAAQSQQAAAQQQLAMEQNKKRQYDQHLGNANRLFDSKQYAQAKQAYQQALDLYPTQAAPRNRISEIDRIMNAQQQDAQYAQAISKADGLLAQKNYTAAKTAYQEALSVKSNENYPKLKINEIDGIIRENTRLQEQQRQQDAQYQLIIQEADNLVAMSRLPDAKAAYQRALSVKPAEAYPKQKITEIDNRIAEQERLAQQQLEREQQLAQQRQLDAQYQGIIREADNLVAMSRLPDAKAAYQRALSVKPAEAYPKQKITEIDNRIAEQERLAQQQLEREQQLAQQRQLDAQYQRIIQEADNLMSMSRLPDAKAAYQRALGVKPGEVYPQQQITKIDQQIAQQQRVQQEKQAKDKQYNDLITQANGLFNAKQYPQAKTAYQQALSVKSTETYPQQRISEIDRILQEQQRLAAEQQRQQAAQQRIDQQYAQALRDADNLFNASRLSEAKTAYQKASNIKAAESYPKQQIVKIDQIMAEQMKQQQAQQKMQQDYQRAITQADQAYQQNRLAEAKTAYQSALRIKAQESYPRQQITKIDQQLAQQEKDRQEKAAFEQKYSNLIASADRAYNSRDYKTAKDGYMNALDMKPRESHPQQRLNKIAEFERIAAAQRSNQTVTQVNQGGSTSTASTQQKPGKLEDLKFANDSERDRYLNSLKGKYPVGVTLEVHKARTFTTYRYVVIRGDEVREFRKVRFNYGDVVYSENGIPTSGQYFESQVKAREGEFYQEFNF